MRNIVETYFDPDNPRLVWWEMQYCAYKIWLGHRTCCAGEDWRSISFPDIPGYSIEGGPYPGTWNLRVEDNVYAIFMEFLNLDLDSLKDFVTALREASIRFMLMSECIAEAEYEVIVQGR